MLVLGLVLRLVLSRNARDRSVISFAAGATLLLVANLVFCGLDLAGSFRPGSAIDAVWLLSFLLIGFAALRSPGNAPLNRGRKAMGRARLGVVLLAVFVPEVVLARDLARRDLIGLNTLTIAGCRRRRS